VFTLESLRPRVALQFIEGQRIWDFGVARRASASRAVRDPEQFSRPYLHERVLAATCMRHRLPCDRAIAAGRSVHQTSRCGIVAQTCCIKVLICLGSGVFRAMPVPCFKVASQAAALTSVLELQLISEQ
jgi:hypothetical protein